eukprot:m.24842 g.24842  ORF g.24842 m.24842 type:complete len:84 (+) comp9140_c0_seq1:60-311(+)
MGRLTLVVILFLLLQFPPSYGTMSFSGVYLRCVLLALAETILLAAVDSVVSEAWVSIASKFDTDKHPINDNDNDNDHSPAPQL